MSNQGKPPDADAPRASAGPRISAGPSPEIVKTVSTGSFEAPPVSIGGAVDALVIIGAADQALIGRRYLLVGTEVGVGREPSKVIHLPLDQVSRNHAHFEKRGERWWCVDDGSTNGTFVNSVRIDRPLLLEHLDRITVGATTLQFFARDAVAAPSRTDDELPFPLAALPALVASRRGNLVRVKTLFDAIERALRFAIAIELSLIVEYGDENAWSELVRMLSDRQIADRALTMGAWEALAARLAALLPENANDPLVSALRSLVNSRGERSPLAKRLAETVRMRNDIVHAVTAADAAYAQHEPQLRSVFDALLLAYRPLSAYRLVSVAHIENIDPRGRFKYALYLHRGALEQFPIIDETLSSPLQNGWCYLLGDKTRPPLLLAPMVASSVFEQTGRVEIFLADGIQYGPEGAKIRVQGVTSSNQHTVEVPWTQRFEALHARIAQAKQRA